MRIALAVAVLVAMTCPARAAPPGDIDKLGWMAGSWIASKDGRTVREIWLSPLGGGMAGASQTNDPGRPPAIQHYRIAAEARGATFTALLPGQAPATFMLQPGTDGVAIFENRDHDFPQRVGYRRCGKDLCAWIEGVLNGEAVSETWRYRRVR